MHSPYQSVDVFESKENVEVHSLQIIGIYLYMIMIHENKIWYMKYSRKKTRALNGVIFAKSHSCTCPDTCLHMTNDTSLGGLASLWTLLVQHEWKLSSDESQHRPLHPAPLSGSQLSTPAILAGLSPSGRQRKLGALQQTLDTLFISIQLDLQSIGTSLESYVA